MVRDPAARPVKCSITVARYSLVPWPLRPVGISVMSPTHGCSTPRQWSYGGAGRGRTSGLVLLGQSVKAECTARLLADSFSHKVTGEPAYMAKLLQVLRA